jgi:putative DNA primase/helicase
MSQKSKKKRAAAQLNEAPSKKSTGVSLKRRAIEYASLGLPEVPMYPCKDGVCACHKGRACQSPGKHPMTPHGVKDATTDPKQIDTWW